MICDIINHQGMSKGLACKLGIQCKPMPCDQLEHLLWLASSVVSHVAR